MHKLSLTKHLLDARKYRQVRISLCAERAGFGPANRVFPVKVRRDYTDYKSGAFSHSATSPKTICAPGRTGRPGGYGWGLGRKLSTVKLWWLNDDCHCAITFNSDSYPPAVDDVDRQHCQRLLAPESKPNGIAAHWAFPLGQHGNHEFPAMCYPAGKACLRDFRSEGDGILSRTYKVQAVFGQIFMHKPCHGSFSLEWRPSCVK